MFPYQYAQQEVPPEVDEKMKLIAAYIDGGNVTGVYFRVSDLLTRAGLTKETGEEETKAKIRAFFHENSLVISSGHYPVDFPCSKPDSTSATGRRQGSVELVYTWDKDSGDYGFSPDSEQFRQDLQAAGIPRRVYKIPNRKAKVGAEENALSDPTANDRTPAWISEPPPRRPLWIVLIPLAVVLAITAYAVAVLLF